jgi:hypothetical protein
VEFGLFGFHLAEVVLGDVICFLRHFEVLVVAERFARVVAVELTFGLVLAVMTGDLGKR